MLKKQTVWLLTLLSLMIVLSVFYMNSPDSDDFSFIFREDKDKDATGVNSDVTDNPGSNEEDNEDGSSVSTSDESFMLIRMELEESRSSQIEMLESVVASSNASNDEKNYAYEEMQQISNLSTKEFIVENSLKDEYGYPDVLVRSLDDSVIVTVKTDETLSSKEANQIMRTVYDEFGTMQVEVKFQPSNS